LGKNQEEGVGSSNFKLFYVKLLGVQRKNSIFTLNNMLVRRKC